MEDRLKRQIRGRDEEDSPHDLSAVVHCGIHAIPIQL